MRDVIRLVRRTFNWDVVIRLALVPVVGYVLAGAALGFGRRAAREAVANAVRAASLFVPQ